MSDNSNKDKDDIKDKLKDLPDSDPHNISPDTRDIRPGKDS